MRLAKPEYFEIKLATDLLLLILLLALLALPVASLGFSGFREGANPQVAGSSSSADDVNRSQFNIPKAP